MSCDGFVVNMGALVEYKGIDVDVVIPPEVDTIGYKAFCGREDVRSVVLPEGLTSIEDRPFANCDGLSSLTVPASVSHIGRHAFSDCPRLTIEYGGTTQAWCALFDCVPWHGGAICLVVRCTDGVLSYPA